MFNKKSYKKVIITILALTMILGTVTLAAEGIYTKQLTATYGKIKFNYEGSDVTSQIEEIYGTPAFISEGRSYAPIRAIADLLGVDIDYDNTTHTAIITDPREDEHRKQLDDKDTEIAKLKAEITKLEKEVKKVKEEEKKEEVVKKDLKSLQTSLNKKYSEYEKVEFDIVLKEEKSNKITIDVTTNLSQTRDEQNWIRMRYSDKKYLMEDLVDQVKKEFKNADITGTIYDSFSRKNLYTFRLNTNGTVSITNSDYIGGNSDYRPGAGSLDSYVDDQFYREYGITGARLYDSNYGTWYDESFEIYFPDTSSNTTEWNRIKNNYDIEYVLDRISKEIEYEYNLDYDRYIYIDIKKGGTLVGTYTRDLRTSTGRFK